MNDTITAISTAQGKGSISIIRVSGIKAIKIVNNIFSGCNLLKVKSHTIHYGYIKKNNKKIDEVLVTIMKAPKTFTREDVVEINTHGGIMSTNKVLELLLLNGARMAEPGEFTKRAFLNGRIDLIEAEGVMDLINAKTEKSMALALNQINGDTSKLIKDLRQLILNILSNIEVNIDYPEYKDIEKFTIKKMEQNILVIKKQINNIIVASKEGQILKNGIKTAIVGRPNVGKSSLLNELLGHKKAIVTNIEGTTRDVVEGSININGIILNLFDTAGIRQTDNLIESIGVEKSLNIIDESNLVLLLLNNNEKLNLEDKKLIQSLKDKKYIIIINKTDLKSNLKLEKEYDNIIYMSIKKKQGIKELKNLILKMFNLDKLDQDDLNYITNAKSLAVLKECLKIIGEIEESIKQQIPLDLIEIDLKTILDKLGEIIGATYEDELINNLFSKFCVGK